MPKGKKSAKTKSNKFNKVEADVTDALKTSKKLHLELKKVKKDFAAIPYRYRQ